MPSSFSQDFIQNIVDVHWEDYNLLFSFQALVGVHSQGGWPQVPGGVPELEFNISTIAVDYTTPNEFDGYVYFNNDPSLGNAGITGWGSQRHGQFLYEGDLPPRPVVISVTWPSFELTHAGPFFGNFKFGWTILLGGSGFNPFFISAGNGDGVDFVHSYTVPGMSGTITLTPTDHTVDQGISGWNVSLAGF